MKRYLSGIVAVVIAISALAFTRSEKKDISPNHPMVTYYYSFSGSHGQENDMSKWIQITADDYANLDCPSGNVEGCGIQNTTNSAGHPTSVPLSGVGGHPILSSPTTALVNKN